MAPTATPIKEEIPTTISVGNTPIPNIVDAAKSVQIFPQDYMEEISLHPELISPSGEKIILDTNLANGMSYKEDSSFTMQMAKVGGETQFENVEIRLDIPSTIYFVEAWAPDEKSFAAIYYDIKYYNGSETCCGEAVAITNLIDGNTKTFTHHWGWNHISQLLWSEDSSKFSVDFFGDYPFLVFNKNGELTKSFPPNSSPLFWSGDLLYYVEKNGDVVQLFTYNFVSQESNQVLDDIIGFKYISHSSQKSKILLTKYASQNDTHNKFYIVDTNLKSIEEVLVPGMSGAWVINSVTSPTKDFVALEGTDGSLWLFDWSMNKFQIYGKIKKLLGWYKNTEGFLVISLDGEQKIIKP